MKILVVEDATDYLTIYRKILERMGHLPIITTSGQDALKIVDANPDIGLVLMDLHLPDFDGVDLCRLIRNKLHDSSVYFILVTGDNSPNVHREGLDAGADDFLTKPFDIGVLQSRIKVGVRSVKMTQQLREERKRAELLSNENILYSQGFNESQQPLVFTDMNGIITHMNRAAGSFYGYSKDELIGYSLRKLGAGVEVYAEHGYSTEKYEEYVKSIWDAMLDPTKGVWDGYVYFKTADGDVKEIHLRLNSMKDGEGELIGFVALLLDVTDILERERAIRYSCYHTIVDLAEARDNETGAHLIRMSKYSAFLAQKLGCPQHFVSAIERFAPFHDIGKVGIPDSILLAPRKLTAEEFNLIKTHPTIGYDILKNAETLKFAGEIAYTHHEKFNGTGYPCGLKGEEIPLSGRIIALADVYDALRTRRPYKEPWSHERVVELITSERGEHFDPQIVDCFLEHSETFCEISEQYADLILS